MPVQEQEYGQKQEKEQGEIEQRQEQEQGQWQGRSRTRGRSQLAPTSVTVFESKLIDTKEITNPENPYWRGRLSTVDLLVLTNLKQLLFLLKILFTFF